MTSSPNSIQKKAQYFAIAACLTLLVACKPNAEERAKMAEERRVYCLDASCHEELYPKLTWEEGQRLTLLKRNGEWFTVPRKYHYSDGLGFNWPLQKPSEAGDDTSKIRHSPYAHIEVFFTGRSRWSDPKNLRPWESRTFEIFLEEEKKRGGAVEFTKINPSVSAYTITHKSDKNVFVRRYYLALKQKHRLGSEAPVASCEISERVGDWKHHICTGGGYFTENIAYDFRFHISHINDWPAIHAEINRILTTEIKKVTP